jgi:hypothetical protein
LVRAKAPPPIRARVAAGTQADRGANRDSMRLMVHSVRSQPGGSLCFHLLPLYCPALCVCTNAPANPPGRAIALGSRSPPCTDASGAFLALGASAVFGAWACLLRMPAATHAHIQQQQGRNNDAQTK